METDIVAVVEDAEVDPATPQTAVDPKFMRIITRTKDGGQLHVRIALTAAPGFAVAVMTHTDGVTFHAEEIDVHNGPDGMVLTVVNPHHGMTITLPRAALKRLQTRIVSLVGS